MAPRDNGITRFGLRNFKAFHYLEDIELAPLTLLVGANSTGKSSIFQSLLLLKQTLLSSSGSGTLKFDGDWVKLGGFSSVISDFDTTRALEFRFATKMPISLSELTDAALGRTAPSSERSMVLVDAQIQLSVVASPPDGSPALNELVIELSAPGVELTAARVRVGRNEFEHGDQKIVLSEPWRGEVIKRFLPDLGSLRQMVLLQRMVADKAENPLVGELFAHDWVLDRWRHELSTRLDYLGPVRADPRPFYPVSDDPEVGTRGEGAVPYLLRHRNEKVSFAPGPTEQLQHGGLFDAVNHWLQRMRVTPGLTIDPVESIAYTAAVRSPLVKSRPINLSQVGFGISQILPVLIQGLRNPADAWVLFEQPEIHLHPRLQGELGDFFLACARTGKTLMVETHSDHLVHRIRRRIAEDTTGELAKLVQILFVRAGTEENPGSYVEPLQVGPDGSIVNWPDDFFQEGADEALAILAARRKRGERPVQ
jgi:predicted ATPase